jgi:hypothetical protein
MPTRLSIVHLSKPFAQLQLGNALAQALDPKAGNS